MEPSKKNYLGVSKVSKEINFHNKRWEKTPKVTNHRMAGENISHAALNTPPLSTIRKITATHSSDSHHTLLLKYITNKMFSKHDL